MEHGHPGYASKVQARTYSFLRTSISLLSGLGCPDRLIKSWKFRIRWSYGYTLIKRQSLSPDWSFDRLNNNTVLCNMEAYGRRNNLLYSHPIIAAGRVSPHTSATLIISCRNRSHFFGTHSLPQTTGYRLHFQDSHGHGLHWVAGISTRL